MKSLMRYAKEHGVDLVGLRELSYKGVNTVKDRSKETNYKMMDHTMLQRKNTVWIDEW